MHKKITLGMNCLLVLLTISSFVFLRTAFADALDSTRSESVVKLYIAVVLDTKEPTFAFRVENNSTSDFRPLPFLQHSNKIVIVRPNGEEKELSIEVQIVSPPGVKPGGYDPRVTVKPKESKTWKESINDLTKIVIHEGEPGLYRIYWKIDDLKSESVYLLKEK